jgi:uncharacterized protein
MNFENRMNLQLEYLNKKNPLGKSFLFFILTFIWSWGFWIPPVLPYFGISVPNWLTYSSYLALFGPSIIGIIMTAAESKKDVKLLLKSTIDFKFKIIWLLPVILVPLVFAGIPALIVFLIGNANPFEVPPATSPAMLVPVLFIILFVGGPIAEEYGWRGYALDRLQLKFNATVSTLILGAFHALWHLPLFLIPGTTVYRLLNEAGMPIYEYLLMVIIQTFMYTWVINNTRGHDGRPNMFLAIMVHLFGNYSSAVFPFYITMLGRWLTFGLNVVFVVIIILIFGYRNMTRNER